MTFVSYAQNFEDVMLWRALKHIEKGFYVDVGAHDPIIDSVSKAFYERGWRGIHIEPMPQYAELLRKDRPDETVLQIGLADSDGTLELNVIPDTGLSTFVDAYAHQHKVERGYEHQRIQVPVLTLKSALRSFVGKDVHWLKIDVEGFEEKVLRGWDSQTLRPWVIVVEATIPNSPETSYASWEPILTEANYQFVYFDGLNRFYIANEHADLAEAFSCPPNVFDGVELSGLATWGLCRGLIGAHQTREKALHTQITKLATELNSTGEVRAQLEAHVQWVQKEWDAAKQRVEQLSRRVGKLEADLESERQHTAVLTAELQVAREYESQLQNHAQSLQKEWDAAKIKIDELNQSSHQWWTAADHLNRELQAVYASKAWRITWPLRKTMQAVRWILELSTRTGRGAVCVPKRIAKPLVLSAMRKTLSNPRLKSHALHALTKYPRLKQRLRQLANRSGWIPSGGMALPPTYPFDSGSGLENTIGTTYPLDMREKSINFLSPRAARIYGDLKRAVEAKKR
jgi:FkbM family methyltransferase